MLSFFNFLIFRNFVIKIFLNLIYLLTLSLKSWSREKSLQFTDILLHLDSFGKERMRLNIWNIEISQANKSHKIGLNLCLQDSSYFWIFFFANPKAHFSHSCNLFSEIRMWKLILLFFLFFVKLLLLLLLWFRGQLVNIIFSKFFNLSLVHLMCLLLFFCRLRILFFSILIAILSFVAPCHYIMIFLVFLWLLLIPLPFWH